MTSNRQHSLASSFGAVDYAPQRPDYARAAVTLALGDAPGARVLDLGAGTGKLTAGLVQAGTDVVAVEPDPAGPEIARVLDRGGVLAGLWNVMDDSVDWVAGLARVSGPAAIGPRVRAFLAGRPETAAGEFTLPMRTCVLRARLLR